MIRYKEPKLHTECVTGSLDSLLSPGHSARFIWSYLDGHLDRKGFEADLHNDEAGCRAYDRVRLFGVWILGLLDGVSSAVKLADLCTRVLEYRWMCGDNPPGHAVLSSFRAESEVELQAWNRQVIEAMRAKEPATGSVLLTDGTILRAAGSRHQVRELGPLQEKLAGEKKGAGRVGPVRRASGGGGPRATAGGTVGEGGDVCRDA